MIDVAKFRARIEGCIEQMHAEHQKSQADWNLYLERNKQEWHQKHDAIWRQVAANITSALDEGRVVVRRMVPDTKYWNEPYSDDKGLRRPEKPHVPTALRQVLDALDLLDEEEISHTALARVGIPSSVMSEVSRTVATYARRSAAV